MGIRAETTDGIKSDDGANYRQNIPVGVKIIKLNKSFGGNYVLRDLYLEVIQGETLVIIGKTGSGKSVLLRHIIGLERPDSGEILINGMDVNDPEVRKKHRFAMVFQSSALFNSLTVSENISLYLREHRLFDDESTISQIVSHTLGIVGLEGKENNMPSELSGGMKKRVAIARALAINPDLILFDEPTSELDPMMAQTIGEAIVNLRKHVEVTQIVVTHHVDLAFYIADRIAVLDQGHIIEVGTPKEIDRSTNPLVTKFITTQFEREEGGRRL